MWLTLTATLLATAAEVESSAPIHPEDGRFGLVATGGPEIVVPDNGKSAQLGLRAGIGARIRLAPFDEHAQVSTIPALALLGGFSGQTSASGFLPGAFIEGRIELLVVRPTVGMLQPGIVVFALGGATFREDGVAPSFGLGLGWNLPFLPPPEKPINFFNGNLFSGSSGAALIPAMIAGVAIIGFVAVGRVEVRYTPARRAEPAFTSILIGFGF